MLDVLSAVTIGRLDAAEVREFVHTFDLVSIHDDGRVRKKRVNTYVSLITFMMPFCGIYGPYECQPIRTQYR